MSTGLYLQPSLDPDRSFCYFASGHLGLTLQPWSFKFKLATRVSAGLSLHFRRGAKGSTEPSSAFFLQSHGPPVDSSWEALSTPATVENMALVICRHDSPAACLKPYNLD